ncbi:MAG TPA: hypothetical protein VKQ30_24925 [Ktedonobacterales bacterium]|nr:hypothetical protein [Ktedonobacterales bacterium]
MPPANLTVLPGSLLPLCALCQQLADGLPAGAVLVVLPDHDGPQRAALETLALVLAAQGRRVTTLAADTVRTPRGQLALPLLA